MRIRVLAAAAALAACFAPSLARAQEVRTLKPTSPWNVDYADDSCALRRSFGTGDGKDFYLELRQFAPGTYFYATVAAPRGMMRGNELRLRFEPDAEARTVDALRVTMGSDRQGYNWADSLRRGGRAAAKTDSDRKDEDTAEWPDAERSRREAELTGLLLQRGFGKPVLLATGEMHKPMEVMRACLDELLTHWGIDAAAQRTLTRKAKPIEQAEWVKEIQNAYPSDMLRRLKSGIVRLRMIVGPDGKAKSCHIPIPSDDPSFEDAACERMMRYARFEPALDANGQPITSYYVTSVIYLVR